MKIELSISAATFLAGVGWIISAVGSHGLDRWVFVFCVVLMFASSVTWIFIGRQRRETKRINAETDAILRGDFR